MIKKGELIIKGIRKKPEYLQKRKKYYGNNRTNKKRIFKVWR